MMQECFIFLVLCTLIDSIPAIEDVCSIKNVKEDKEEDEILFSLKENSDLYSSPTSSKRITLELENRLFEDINFTLSFQETFPVFNPNRKMPHVELVKTVHPSQVSVEQNSTQDVHVDLHIADYVPVGHRAKVTVIAAGLASSDSLYYFKKETSFHFLVVDNSAGHLHSIEDNQYSSELSPMCIEDKRPLSSCTSNFCSTINKDSCEDYYWETYFKVLDVNSGLTTAEVQYPGSGVIFKTWKVRGTTDVEMLAVRQNCCDTKLCVNVTNILGYSSICNVGDCSTSGIASLSWCLLILIFLTTV